MLFVYCIISRFKIYLQNSKNKINYLYDTKALIINNVKSR